MSYDDRHNYEDSIDAGLSPEELVDRDNPDVGEGTPDTAPAVIDHGHKVKVTDGYSPKMIAALVSPPILGLIIMALDLAGILKVEDGVWLAMIGAGPVAGAAAFKADPGAVVTEVKRDH